MAKISSFFSALIIVMIRVYHIAISSVLAPSCRFEPSCSNYMIKAISEHGLFKGIYFGCCRVLKCHPWHVGGYDPVPGKSNHVQSKH